MPNQNQVLVVDDNDDVLYVTCKRLRAAGFDPVPASDGVQALRRMAEHPSCRKMITDYSMPNLGGATWLELLEQRCADWTVVVVSSRDVDPGPFVSVPKPADYEGLVRVFAQADA